MSNRRTTPSARGLQSPPPAPKAAPGRRTSPAVSSAPAPGASGRIPEAERRAMIAQAAYLRAERRGFAPGGEIEDWLAAEAEVDALLKAGHGGPPQ